MKKEKGSRIVNTFKNIFQLRYWSDFDRIKGFWDYLVNAFKKLFIPPTRQQQGSAENFEQAVNKMQLSEADLFARERALKRLSIWMSFLFCIIFLYAFFHLFWGSWPGFFLSAVVSFLALTLAFRYHFWYYQIKTRKLGCSITEWFKQGILGDKR